MFCIKCGRAAAIENLCEKCFLEKKELFTVRAFRLDVCDCGSYYDNKWQKPEEECKMIADQINQRIETKNKIIDKSIDIKKAGNKILATIVCSGFIKPAKSIKKERKYVTIILKQRKCENCIKALGGYYEAVLQLRGSNSEKILKKLKGLVGHAFLIELKEGYDIRFMRKNDAKKLAKQLKNTFVVKQSFKFVTTKKGKELYRNYYSIK